MTEQPIDLVLELLRVMRSDISEIRTDIRDVKARIGSIESYIATLHGDQARAALKMDDLTARVERLEKRTGLVDA
jgi:phage shock protein A